MSQPPVKPGRSPGFWVLGCFQLFAGVGMLCGLLVAYFVWDPAYADTNAVVAAVDALKRVVIRGTALVCALLCCLLLVVCQVGHWLRR
jgi:hypothetical protein